MLRVGSSVPTTFQLNSVMTDAHENGPRHSRFCGVMVDSLRAWTILTALNRATMAANGPPWECGVVPCSHPPATA